MIRKIPLMFAAVLLLGTGAAVFAQSKGDFAATEGVTSPQIRGTSPIVIDYPGGQPDPATGALSNTDSTYNRLLSGCGAPSGVGTAVFFDEAQLTNNAAGDLNVRVFTSGPDGATCAGSGDTFLTAYAPTFNPATPSANCVASDDDGGDGLCSSVTITIPQGETYSLVVTSFGNAATFDWQLNFECQGDCPDVGGGGPVPPPEALPVPAISMAGLAAMLVLVLAAVFFVMRRNA